eukprot:sb/3473092/
MFCESILLFHPRFSPTAVHATRVRTHQILQIVGLIMACSGGWVIWTVKEGAGKDHITTWHALIGVITLCLSVINALNGAPLIYPQLRKLPLMSVPLAALKKRHAKLGLLTYHMCPSNDRTRILQFMVREERAEYSFPKYQFRWDDVPCGNPSSSDI